MGRPVLAGGLLAVVELAVVLQSGGRALFSSVADSSVYLLSALGIGICLCVGLWAMGSWITRWTGAVGQPKGEDELPGQVTGVVAGVAAGMVAAWLLWELTKDSTFEGASARAAIVLVVAPLVGFFVGWIATWLTITVRRDGGSTLAVGLAGLALPSFVALDAFWVPHLYPELHLGLALAAVLSALAIAVALPKGEISERTRRVGLITALVVVIAGLASISRYRNQPEALRSVETYAPITGKVIRALTRSPNES